MSYATQAQLQLAAGGPERFLALTDWNGDNAIDADVVAEALKRADAWIDGFIPVQYSPPIATPSETLIRLAVDEAIYWLRSKREMVSDAEIKQREERERYLESVRSGKIRPDTVTSTKSAAVRPVVVRLSDDTAVDTSRDGLKGIW